MKEKALIEKKDGKVYVYFCGKKHKMLSSSIKQNEKILKESGIMYELLQ
jgi:hypothetical protein